MIIFLYGKETFLARRKLNVLKDKFTREVDASGGAINIIDGERARLEEINEAASPASLFSRKRMVIIDGLFANKQEDFFKNLLDYLKKRKGDADDNILIFVDPVSAKDKLNAEKNALFTFLSKQKYSEEFKELPARDAAVWARDEAGRLGAEMSLAAATILSGLSANSLWQISNEVLKLVNYKKGAAKKDEPIVIAPKDVEDLVVGQGEASTFAFTDAVSARNKDLAFRLLNDQIKSGADSFSALNILFWQFKTLLMIREALDEGYSSRKIATAFGLHPFVVQKGVAQARHFTAKSLKNIIARLLEADYLFKSGKGDLSLMLDLIIKEL